ncbi:MAG TPA: hypothetical protein VHO73_07400 [Methylomirabilota bacterium]|jgi:hypothetical protein|nr:hypothetical protein [Methylomirabilota bacterium]
MGEQYELQETINGVTFIYRAPEVDPTVKPLAGGTFKEGDYEDQFFWVDGDDPPETFVIMDAEPGGASDVVKVFARDAARNWWKYKINTTNQTWRRRNRTTAPGAPRPVSQLRIKVNQLGEATHPIATIEVGGTLGDYCVVTHPGSTCTIVWNPATRRYQRVCG